jgi:methyl-accepting chemotaxis protein
MDKTTIFGIILMFIIIAGAVLLQFQSENKHIQEVTSLVDQAVVKIQEKGESAFPEFNASPWIKGDIYVFVWRADGIRVVYPPDPGGVGQNMTNLKDVTGKPIGKIFIETALKGGGWVEYYWPKPNSTIPLKKITYIQDAQYKNQTYIVGSGFYQ